MVAWQTAFCCNGFVACNQKIHKNWKTSNTCNTWNFEKLIEKMVPRWLLQALLSLFSCLTIPKWDGSLAALGTLFGNFLKLNLEPSPSQHLLLLLGSWPFSCRSTWIRATEAVPMGVGIHTHVSIHTSGSVGWERANAYSLEPRWNPLEPEAWNPKTPGNRQIWIDLMTMRRCLHCCEGSTRIIFATQWMQWDALKGISSAKLQGLARKRYTSYLCGHSAAWPGIRMAEGPRSDFAICSVFVILKIQWYPHSICRSTLQQFVGHAKNVKEHEGDVSNMLILSQAAVAVPFSCWQQ